MMLTQKGAGATDGRLIPRVLGNDPGEDGPRGDPLRRL